MLQDTDIVEAKEVQDRLAILERLERATVIEVDGEVFYHAANALWIYHGRNFTRFEDAYKYASRH